MWAPTGQEWPVAAAIWVLGSLSWAPAPGTTTKTMITSTCWTVTSSKCLCEWTHLLSWQHLKVNTMEAQFTGEEPEVQRSKWFDHRKVSGDYIPVRWQFTVQRGHDSSNTLAGLLWKNPSLSRPLCGGWYHLELKAVPQRVWGAFSLGITCRVS